MTRVVRRSSRSNSSSGSMRTSTDHTSRTRHLQPRPLSSQNSHKPGSLSPHDSRARRSLQPSSSESPQLITHQDHLSSHRSPIAERLTPQTPESFHSLGSSTDSSYVISNYGADMSSKPDMRSYHPTGGAGPPRHHATPSLPQSFDGGYVPSNPSVVPQQGTTYDAWTRNGKGLPILSLTLFTPVKNSLLTGQVRPILLPRPGQIVATITDLSLATG